MPTTAIIISTGVALSYATAARYLLSGVHFHIGTFQLGIPAWSGPDLDWLGFIALLLGVGTTHFGIKRHSDYEALKAKNPHSITAATAEVTAQDVNVHQTKGAPDVG